MSRTTIRIAIDDDALHAVAEALGTTSKVDPVNEALRVIARQHRQVLALERAAGEGTFTGLPIGDEAWR